MVDVDEKFPCDGDDGFLVSAAFADALIELVESWVAACCMLRGFDEDPAYVAVAFLRDVAV